MPWVSGWQLFGGSGGEALTRDCSDEFKADREFLGKTYAETQFQECLATRLRAQEEEDRPSAHYAVDGLGSGSEGLVSGKVTLALGVLTVQVAVILLLLRASRLRIAVGALGVVTSLCAANLALYIALTFSNSPMRYLDYGLFVVIGGGFLSALGCGVSSGKPLR